MDECQLVECLRKEIDFVMSFLSIPLQNTATDLRYHHFLETHPGSNGWDLNPRGLGNDSHDCKRGAMLQVLQEVILEAKLSSK